jgi:hypothetical protein
VKQLILSYAYDEYLVLAQKPGMIVTVSIITTHHSSDGRLTLPIVSTDHSSNERILPVATVLLL